MPVIQEQKINTDISMQIIRKFLPQTRVLCIANMSPNAYDIQKKPMSFKSNKIYFTNMVIQYPHPYLITIYKIYKQITKQNRCNYIVFYCPIIFTFIFFYSLNQNGNKVYISTFNTFHQLRKECAMQLQRKVFCLSNKMLVQFAHYTKEMLKIHTFNCILCFGFHIQHSKRFLE